MGSPGPLSAMSESNHPVILFDGVCNLCNSSVQFVINHDPKGKFRFSALQSEFGQQQLEKHQFNKEELLSVVLLIDGKAYDKSRAALEIAKNLSGLWPLMYAFIVVPPFIRNFVYNWISRNRYRWFGRRDECMIPTPELKARFIN
ncbi:MAG TPA: thiol-disulfide oxidoreductase DCC family protein [Cyclobacteriaceae bacterium]|nr:thiol-disulfide oxidoreductase DCC family protein [Cyclobacteriaceae bacterium]